jgi:hypothetical protein
VTACKAINLPGVLARTWHVGQHTSVALWARPSLVTATAALFPHGWAFCIGSSAARLFVLRYQDTGMVTCVVAMVSE